MVRDSSDYVFVFCVCFLSEMSHYKSKMDCGCFISAVNPQNPLWCHDEEVGYSGLLGDSIGGEVVGFSCFVGRFLQRDAETQTLSHQLHLMIPEPPLPPHTHTHTHARAPQPSPLLETSRPSTHKITHIYTLSPAVTPIFPIWCSFEILLSYIYIYISTWLTSIMYSAKVWWKHSHTIFPSPPHISRQIGIFKAVCTLWRPVVIFDTSLSLKWQPFWCF